MRKGFSAVAALALVVTSMLGAVACGSDDDDDSGGGGAQKGGGSITIGTVGPDKYDPVLFQTVQAVQPLQLVYTPLVTYKHEEGSAGTEIVPGLAEEVPEPTNGGKTYSFKLRPGLKYSDGTAVKASDFENSIKRLFKLGSVWSSFYTGIVGAEEFQEKGDSRRTSRGSRRTTGRVRSRST